VITVDFTVMGIPCMGLNGGPEFKHNEAFSFRSQLRVRKKLIVIGTRSSVMVARRVCAAGAKISGVSHGR
jgi:hypothetical protein